MTNELKPTNDEIANYILEWIESFDDDALVITDIDSIIDTIENTKRTNFKTLREMFAPVMYDSIQEYVEKEK